jgi:hypothetical protein
LLERITIIMPNYVLRYYQAPYGWRDLPLAAGQISIGSDPHNNLVLDDRQVAPQHAWLHLDTRGVFVKEVSPQFPVLVEGRRIASAAGQWAQLKPGQGFSLGQVTLRVDQVSSAPASPPARRGLSMLPLGLGALFVCACVAVGGLALGGGLLMTQNGRPAISLPLPAASEAPASGAPATAQPLPTFAPPKVVADLAVGPGAEVKDDAGASLSLPQGVISPTTQASLTVSQLGGEMAAEIDKSYKIESRAYAVSAESVGPGRPTLRIPAGPPGSRLAMLIDNRYLGVLDVAPQDGQFVIDPRLAAPQSASPYPSPKGGEQASQYLVVTPRQAGAFQPAAGRAFKLASPLMADADGASCVAERFTLNHCWRNPESSVYVFWKDDYPAELKDQDYLRVGDVIRAVADIMKAYQSQGFAHAGISSSYRVDVVMDAGVSEPFYSPRSGNLYLPWDIASKIGDASSRCTLAHELFHWMEDEEYRMLPAYYSHPKSWWLETAAENGTFRLDAACIEKNLVAYGKVETEDNMLAFQSRPLVWAGGEGARYIHAQQLYLSICPGASCAMTPEAFVQAINSGTYPMDGSALAAYEGAAGDMARYLLGAAPLSTRSDAAIPSAAVGGQGYGDYAILKKTSQGFAMESGMTSSQFKKNGDQELKIEATIQKGGVYPLWVANGKGTPYAAKSITGLPSALKVEPGPAFWVKMDDQDPVLYKGDSPVVLGAISDQVGIGRLRIGAYAPTKDEVFRATLGIADLSGDWMSAAPPNFVYKSLSCGDSSETDTSSLDKAESDPFLVILGGMGAFGKDPAAQDGSHLIWQASQELPERTVIEADVTLKPEVVELKYRVEIPKQEGNGQSSWLPGTGPRRALPGFAARVGELGGQLPPGGQGAGWLLLASLGVGGVGLLRKPAELRRWLPAAGLLALSAVLVTGCFGFNLYGTIEGAYTFKKLEAINPKDNSAATPYTWKLSNGSGSINMDLTIVTTTTDEDGQEVSNASPCQATLEFKPEVFIGPPDMVTLPKQE